MNMALTNTPLKVDREQLQRDFDALADLTEPGKPWTRRSFTPMFLKGRDYLAARFAEEGLATHIDTSGNLTGTWFGSNPDRPVLMTGSHSDTVPSGGRFDGIAGILCGLAAIRALRLAGYQPEHSIELVDFLAEEPSEWGLSCIGSRGMVGALTDTHFAMSGPDGERLDTAITRMGGKPEAIAQTIRSDVAAFVEIHIEQGPVLEAEDIPLGVVSGIAGIARVRLRLEGEAGHAGTVPMAMRKDAGIAISRLLIALRDAASAEADKGRGHFTATIGVMHLEPNGANVVPGAAEAIVDIRAENDAAMDDYLALIETLAADAATAEGCVVAAIERLSRTFAVACDDRLQTLIRDAADAHGLATRPLASGAGHDAAFVARIAPAAMIFVPSRGGISHAPEEWTDNEAIARAADVLTLTLSTLDQRPLAPTA
ncbi:MAG: Zn-dependent hydrolase [Candidatus Devosia phytovorans]|uniref:Zn-dependent hydrolase n=1 Tax=Candidatus Devosia phytovorans TaxID=3121372 RepID=A0AAJ5VRR8_9HYPH|nr:Zn-dependent hydrolase [Devosia sp.]WEK02935.1 MAG: Zn-dependent hydrolase [Devosia sp.]